MTRSFDGTPVDVAFLEGLCADALWAPTAGNTAGVRLSIIGAVDVPAYFARATDEDWRARSPRSDGLSRAGAVVLVSVRVRDYLDRYGELDKASSDLHDRAKWPLPYWHADAAMATMALLLLLEESGWQAALWGNFRNDAAVLDWADIRDEELFASVLIGRADGNDAPSQSLRRAVPARRERVRRVAP
jgi:hypothetical protein